MLGGVTVEPVRTLAHWDITRHGFNVGATTVGPCIRRDLDCVLPPVARIFRSTSGCVQCLVDLFSDLIIATYLDAVGARVRRDNQLLSIRTSKSHRRRDRY